jgi:hypothetical protein
MKIGCQLFHQACNVRCILLEAPQAMGELKNYIFFTPNVRFEDKCDVAIVPALSVTAVQAALEPPRFLAGDLQKSIQRLNALSDEA